jgi:hypothetical protein
MESNIQQSAIEYDKIDPELILIKLKEILAFIQKKKQEKIK